MYPLDFVAAQSMVSLLQGSIQWLFHVSARTFIYIQETNVIVTNLIITSIAKRLRVSRLTKFGVGEPEESWMRESTPWISQLIQIDLFWIPTRAEETVSQGEDDPACELWCDGEGSAEFRAFPARLAL